MVDSVTPLYASEYKSWVLAGLPVAERDAASGLPEDLLRTLYPHFQYGPNGENVAKALRKCGEILDDESFLCGREIDNHYNGFENYMSGYQISPAKTDVEDNIWKDVSETLTSRNAKVDKGMTPIFFMLVQWLSIIAADGFVDEQTKRTQWGIVERNYSEISSHLKVDPDEYRYHPLD